MSATKISVIMSVFNGEKYLGSALDSIIAQTYGDFECIVVNDHSNDGTEEILASYSKDKRVKVLRNASNRALTYSLNKALMASDGEYIARMDADDISLPDRFEQQVNFLDSNIGHGLIGSNYYEIDDEGKRVGEILLPTSDADIREHLFKFNPFNHSAVMMRKSALHKAGKYDEQFQRSQDYELWFRILSAAKGANLPNKLLLRRNPPGSITVRRKKEQLYFTIKAWTKGCMYIQPRLIKDYPYLARLLLLYSIPHSFIPALRRRFSREKYKRAGQYYVINLAD